MDVITFVQEEYLPHVSVTLAASTQDGYKKQWRAYSSYFDQRSLNLRTCDCQAIMRAIAADNPQLNKTSLRHTKNFFSGIWAHGLRMGQIDRDSNPWKSVAIPQAPEVGETHAYAPEEVEAMLAALPAPYNLVILVAACTGLRKSELRGVQWQDWDASTNTLSVNRAVWRGHTKTTKSRASKAPVPVVPVLATRLEDYKRLVSGRAQAFIFSASNGKPLDLDNAARRIISPVVGDIWKGWHAFRRGLATFLHAQGIDDKTIQAILRHENVAITQASYIKTVPDSVRKAMDTVKFGEVR